MRCRAWWLFWVALALWAAVGGLLLALLVDRPAHADTAPEQALTVTTANFLNVNFDIKQK